MKIHDPNIREINLSAIGKKFVIPAKKMTKTFSGQRSLLHAKEKNEAHDWPTQAS
jgi:hypothetical protein